MADRLQDLAGGKAEPRRGFSAWIAGRCRRREYWLWIGPIFACLFALGFVGIPGLELVFALPMLFVWIRRLHDLGRTGWWAPVINIAIAIIGWVESGVVSHGAEGGMIQSLVAVGVVIALGSIPGQRGDNAFGPPPGRAADLAETFS